MTQTEFVFEEAAKRRDDGIASAVAHAESEQPGWKELALLALRSFIEGRNSPFLAEDFRLWTMVHNACPQPPEPRAWGGVLQSAKKQRLIAPCGTSRAATSNLSPKVLWVKL